MKPNQPLNLSDLITLEGLTKPDEGASTIELGANSKKTEKLQAGVTDLAEKMEESKDVKAGELANLVDTMKQALVHELSLEKSAEILATLKQRFEKQDKFYKSAEGLSWEKIQTKLKDNPEKLWSLNEMERTGGEPDVMGYDKTTGEYIFIDCSEESPKDRRNCFYDREGEEIFKRDYPNGTCNSNAINMAELMGVNLLNKEEYEELQTKGKFDKNSWSWIKTPVDKRKSGVARFGYRFQDDVYVSERDASNLTHSRGFRASLRV